MEIPARIWELLFVDVELAEVSEWVEEKAADAVINLFLSILFT